LPVVVDRAVRTRFREGDPDAVRAVYTEYGRLVYAVAFRALGDHGLAEEATQQTFLRAWRAADRLDPEREMAPWLAAIVRRVAIDVHRREALRSADPIDELSPGDPALVSSTPAVEGVIDTWEVREAVAALPADEAAVVRLQHFEGLTHTQIADRLGVAVGTVKSRSFRAHRQLATVLGHLRD
jgi:RNA polymerase sigma-70 factor (ECF subfamily)